MRAFGGEPVVGEIVGLRTFRVDESGLLLPLYSAEPWYEGTNSATCAPPAGRHAGPPHAAPGDGCECGFYAYGTMLGAARHRQFRYVRAVVSCWGDVVAGTLGVRAQHARIDALWLGPGASTELIHRVRARYPSARLYADTDAMLAEHPLSVLPCYADPQPQRRVTRVVGVLAGLAALCLGALPADWLRASEFVWLTWLALIVLVALGTVWLLTGTRGAGHIAAGLMLASLLAWLVAPLCGLPGWLLRLPLLRGLLVLAGTSLLALRPGHFPVVRDPRPERVTVLRP